MGRDAMGLPDNGRSAGSAAARFADVSAPPPASSHPGPAPEMPAPPMTHQPMPGQPIPGQPMPGQYAQAPDGRFGGDADGPYGSGSAGHFGGGVPQMPAQHRFQGPGQGPQAGVPESGYSAVPHEQGPYSGPQPAAHAPVPQPMTISLADAVQAAHAEGFGFGDAVARDAPALWLEAVLARKPRMPSDLEARLLQDSSLPIDSLLHDEVRHSLRRGFWDALERSRR